MATKIIIYFNLAFLLWLIFMLIANAYPEYFTHPVFGVFWEILTIPVLLGTALSTLYSIYNTIKNRTDPNQIYLWILNVVNLILVFTLFSS